MMGPITDPFSVPSGTPVTNVGLTERWKNEMIRRMCNCFKRSPTHIIAIGLLYWPRPEEKSSTKVRVIASNFSSERVNCFLTPSRYALVASDIFVVAICDPFELFSAGDIVARV